MVPFLFFLEVGNRISAYTHGHHWILKCAQNLSFFSQSAQVQQFFNLTLFICEIKATREHSRSNLGFSFQDCLFIINYMMPLLICDTYPFQYLLPCCTFCWLEFTGIHFVCQSLFTITITKQNIFRAPLPVEYSNAQVLKAPLQNLQAPIHHNTYHHHIKLLYILSQNKRYSEPPFPVNSMVIY